MFINSIPDAVIISNTKGNIVQVNDAAVRLFKYEVAEFKEITIEDLVPGDVRRYHTGLRDDFFANPRPRLLDSRYSLSLRAINKLNNEFPIESSLFAIDSDQGKLAINILRDISERKSQEKSLKQQAFHDALTGLPNRHYFNDMARRAYARSKRITPIFAILYIDIDEFKPVNDTYGHEAGDLLLIEIANRISSVMREGDFAARLGGDEFVCMLYNLESKDDAINIAKRIIAKCAEPLILEKHKVQVAASIGISFSDQPAKDFMKLLTYADQAMYEAKKQGGDKYVISAK